MLNFVHLALHLVTQLIRRTAARSRHPAVSLGE